MSEKSDSGLAVTCERGHYVCTIDHEPMAYEPISAGMFSMFAEGVTPFKDGELAKFRCCPLCDAEVFRVIAYSKYSTMGFLQIHIEGLGWAPDPDAHEDYVGD